VTTESNRIAFVVARDGLDEARAWARRTLAIYRAAVRPRNGRRTPYGAAYRRKLVESCVTLRSWLKGAS
jgi:hypothetical protein